MKTHHGLFNHMVKEYGLEMFRRELERIAAIVTEDNWQTFEEHDALNKEGPCWIVYKGKVKKAYKTFGGFYEHDYITTKPAYLSEYITHCMDEIVPQPPID